MAKATLFPNGQLMAILNYIEPTPGNPIPWDGSVSVSVTSDGSAIEDGVDPDIKATVIESTDDPGTFGLVVLTSDGANIGGGGSGGAVTVGNGADVTQGAIADVAVTGDTNGTLSAKLRGLNKILADVWDSVNSRLKVFIVNTTIAVTQSGSWVISAGSAIIGKVSIDQTTPGTTNAVSTTNLPTTVDTNSGNKSASTLRVVLATDQPSLTNDQPVKQATAANLNAQIVGNIANDGVDSGNPIKIGAIAKSPDGTPAGVVAEDDRSDIKSDLNGIQFVRTDNPRAGHKHLDGSTAYTDESLVAAPGSGLQIIITNIIFGSNAATAINFFLEEGSTKIFGPYALEAVAGRGFCSGPIRLPITPNTAVTLTTSASIAQAFDVDYFIQNV